jgi:hypothetical protein
VGQEFRILLAYLAVSDNKLLQGQQSQMSFATSAAGGDAAGALGGKMPLMDGVASDEVGLS